MHITQSSECITFYCSTLVQEQDFQQMREAVLESLVESQQPGALYNIMLLLGPYEKEVNLKFPLVFIIGIVNIE
jgi:hypothetical protein